MSEPLLGSERGVSRAGIVLEDVRCTGTESSIFGCPTSQLGVIDNPECQNAAAVTCTRGELDNNSTVTVSIKPLSVLR